MFSPRVTPSICDLNKSNLLSSCSCLVYRNETVRADLRQAQGEGYRDRLKANDLGTRQVRKLWGQGRAKEPDDPR